MKKILVVDDNQAAADGLVKLLNAMSWNAHALYSGHDLLEYLKTESADIAFIDIGMPEMDGYATVIGLRANGHEFPVVALSGYGQEEDIERAHNAGFTAHMVKPAGVAELRAVLEELVGTGG